MTLNEIGNRAKEVSRVLGTPGSREKNMGLKGAARALLEGEEEILEANSRNYEKARSDGMNQGLLDRLRSTLARVQAMADGLLRVAALEDPAGEVLSMKFRPNGLQIGRKRVLLGAIGMIYETRPNVTADAFGLCFKSSNAAILKGEGDTLYSNMTITRYLCTGSSSAGLSEDSVQLIEDTNRGTTRELMRLNRYTGVLTSRGGAGLIRTVVENSTIPAVETGTGNCHVYTNAPADQNMVLDTIFSARTQRIGVCDAYEFPLAHRDIAEESPPLLRKKLEEKQMEIRGDGGACVIEPSFVRATEEDWGREYPDYTLSLKLVDSVNETIRHTNTYNAGHSETIATPDYFNAQRFLDKVDTMVVYVSASARLMDGEELGPGAGTSISIQELHAGGPMDPKELTTTKYIICGDRRVRW